MERERKRRESEGRQRRKKRESEDGGKPADPRIPGSRYMRKETILDAGLAGGKPTALQSSS